MTLGPEVRAEVGHCKDARSGGLEVEAEEVGGADGVRVADLLRDVRDDSGNGGEGDIDSKGEAGREAVEEGGVSVDEEATGGIGGVGGGDGGLVPAGMSREDVRFVLSPRG